MDLLTAEVHPWAADRFRQAAWLIVPHTVRWEGEVGAVPPLRSGRLAYDLRRLRRLGYTREVAAGSRTDWSEFYHRMVLPTARTRFGAEAYITSRALRRELARRGTLLFVRVGTERVAGLCALEAGETLWVALVGVRDGDPLLLERGASAALYPLSFDWARERRLRRVDWGPSSPFLRDGLHRYKRKWGLAPVLDPLSNLTALHLNPACAALRRAFAYQPVLVDTGGSLEVYAGTDARPGG